MKVATARSKQSTHAALKSLAAHISEVQACALCPNMIGPVVTPQPVATRVYLAGQAPGPHEGRFGKPFAWTAGKTLFRWFETQGIDEETFRNRAWIGAVCRCFPGKTKQGSDRVPNPLEIQNCSRWMEREFALLQPELVIPVGRMAIERFFPPAPLKDLIGRQHRIIAFGREIDAIPLPHPSGASTWFKVEPGKTLLAKALKLLGKHPAWRAMRG